MSANQPSLVVFADRLTQLVDRHPDLFRKGQGRIKDFATRYRLHHTTANKILAAQAFPDAELLFQIAQDFHTSLDWLMGRGPADIDELLEGALLNVEIFSPRSNAKEVMRIPPSILPAGADSSKLIGAVVRRSGPNLITANVVLVKVMSEPQEGANHLLYDPVHERTLTARINVNLQRTKVSVASSNSGSIETIDYDSVVFGELEGAEKLSIVGPVVGVVSFDPTVIDRA